MAVLGVYEIEPAFPASALDPTAERYYCNHVWVDHTGDRPTDQQVLDMSILVRYAMEKRHKVEEGGFMLNGLLIVMDDAAMLLTMLGAVTMTDTETVTYIDRGINYGAFTGLQIRGMLTAMKDFMASTFTVLATVLAGIVAGTITTTEEIDAAAWPS